MIILISEIETAINEIKHLLEKEITKILFFPSSLSNKEKTYMYKNKIVETLGFSSSNDLEVDVWGYDVNKDCDSEIIILSF